MIVQHSMDHEDAISDSESFSSVGTIENDVQQLDVSSVVCCRDVILCLI